MFIFELIGTALGVSMDAFSVALGKGLTMKQINYKAGFIIAAFFGGFQALMPFVGYLIVLLCRNNTNFEVVIINNASLLACVLLCLIGFKMIFDVFDSKKSKTKKNNTSEKIFFKINYVELVLLSIATSIDALMVGFAFATIKMDMILTIVVIGFTTFILSLAAIFIGHFFGSKWKKPSTIAGGIILILIGLRFLAGFFNVF